MLPLPEHLQRSLTELSEYYEHLQADYAAKLEGVQRQVLAIEALQSGGGIAPPPEMVVHLQELERYYTRALAEVAEQVLLAGAQRDRVELIIGSTSIVKNLGLAESVAPETSVTHQKESGSELQEVTPNLQVAGYEEGVSPSGGIASQVQSESPGKEPVGGVLVEPRQQALAMLCAELPSYLPKIGTPESSNVTQVLVESDVHSDDRAISSEYDKFSGSSKESTENESVEIAVGWDGCVEDDVPPEITLLNSAVVLCDRQTYAIEPEREVESVKKGNTFDRQSIESQNVAVLAHPLSDTAPLVKDSHESDPRRKVTPVELLNQFLMSLHHATRNQLNVCKTSGKLYIEERDGVTTLVIVPNDRELDKRISQRLSAYQERFNAFLGKPSSVVHISSVPIAPPFPQYNGLSLKQAIAKLLTNNRGIILHREYIVREIYGELPREVKPNTYRKVSQTLKAGVTQRLWDADPDNPDCYTIDYSEILKPE